jgi:hypothetical protein
MQTYNLFRRKNQEELACAVPVDRPLPTFLTDALWEFGGTTEGKPFCSWVFNREAAEASVRYNGFYLFQLIRASDVQLPLARCTSIPAREAPARREDLLRKIPRPPDRPRDAPMERTDTRSGGARVLEELSNGF